MVRNYIKIAWRSLLKNRQYSLLHIIGLSISLAATVLILLWVWDEWSYDTMHQKAADIYTMTVTVDPEHKEVWHVSPSAIASFAKGQITDIEKFARTYDAGSQLITYEGKNFQQDVEHVDPDFFEIFDFPFVYGNRQQPFANLHSVILSESLAQKYFGDDNPLGKVLTVDKIRKLTVSAVIKDMPHNSSLQYQMILPFDLLRTYKFPDLDNNWDEFDYETVVLLKPTANVASVSKELTKIHKANNLAAIEDLRNFSYGLFPLLDIHLSSEGSRGKQQVWIFTLVAAVILLIASINYVNLVTARATRRNKEVGVRKIVGASSTHLFWQFLSESCLIFFIAAFIALSMIFALLPFYNDISGKQLTLSLVDHRIWMLLGSTLFVLLLLAGVYPALKLSKFHAARVLKDGTTSTQNKSSLRQSLVVIQFCCSVVLIMSTIVIAQQLAFIRKKDLGYDKENVFTFPRKNLKNIATVKTSLLNSASIQGVSLAAEKGLDNAEGLTTVIDWKGKPRSMINYIIYQLAVEHDFTNVLHIPFVAGHGFTGTPADSNSFILNETAAKQMSAKVGLQLSYEGKQGTVIGITQDFHFQDMKKAIGPLILSVNQDVAGDYFYVRSTANGTEEALKHVKQLWDQYNSDYEFSYWFLEETFDRLYREDIRIGTLFNLFAGIAILLSCLGLFGLVTFTAETKVKEIGIRKTLGASIGNIMLMLTRDFIQLVALGLIIAAPLGYWIMNTWLANYAYRITIQWWVLPLASLTALLIALATVCGKSLRAARANPVDSLRNE